MRYQVAPHCIIEQLGDELLICDPSREIALQVTGTTAQVFRQFQATGSLDGAEPESIVSLVDAGILLPVGQQGLLGRRALITAGAGVVGLGIVALALPNAAAASSPSPTPDPTPDPTVDPVTPSSTPTVLVPERVSDSPLIFIGWFDGSTPIPYTWSITGSDPATPALSATPSTLSSDGNFKSWFINNWQPGQRMDITITASNPYNRSVPRSPRRPVV
jgi:hypothetical protein